MAHWQPKDRKEDIAQDIREFVQRDDPQAEMHSLQSMKAHDLTALMLALRSVDKLEAAARTMLGALNALLNAGNYNSEGEWVLPSGDWDGQGEPPDTCDHPAMDAVNAAIKLAEAAGITAKEG